MVHPAKASLESSAHSLAEAPIPPKFPTASELDSYETTSHHTETNPLLSYVASKYQLLYHPRN